MKSLRESLQAPEGRQVYRNVESPHTKNPRGVTGIQQLKNRFVIYFANKLDKEE